MDISVFFLQVDFWFTCKCYSDKKRFPSHFRTIPSDAYQSAALARLAILFGWSYIGVIEGFDQYGKFGVAQFVEEVQNAGVCIAFHHKLDPDDKLYTGLGKFKVAGVRPKDGVKKCI